MPEDEKNIVPMIKSVLSELIGAEDIVLEATRELVKDEIKRVIKIKLEENPALRDEIKEAISMYLEAKGRQVFAAVKLAKCGAKLGLELLPPALKKDISKEVMSSFEKELSEIIAKGL
ncbi:MAG: hypothetical protein ACUVV6_01360 [Thermoplasmatota archaeon]